MMDLDDDTVLRRQAGPSNTNSSSIRPQRPRRATVTRTNYRSEATNHRRGGGGGGRDMEDDDDDEEEEGEATGDEEDLTMG